MAADAPATAHLQTDQEDGIPEDQCRNCGRVGTLSEVPSWPCHRTTGEVVCPACSAYARAHGGAARPPRLWHRERQQLLEAAAEPGADVHKCCHCGLLPKAGERHKHFHRRTQERLCSTCEIYAWRHAGRMRPAALLEAYRGGWAAPGAARCPPESRRVPSEQWEMPGRWAAWRMAAEPAATGQRGGQGALQQGQLLVTQQAAAAELEPGNGPCMGPGGTLDWTCSGPGQPASCSAAASRGRDCSGKIPPSQHRSSSSTRSSRQLIMASLHHASHHGSRRRSCRGHVVQHS
ncbi:hypothetical protein ABPG77_010654 [Micractinium sp. CCAP 211/92]